MNRHALSFALAVACVAEIPLDDECLVLTEVSTTSGGQQVDLGGFLGKPKGPVVFQLDCALAELETPEDELRRYVACDPCSRAYCPDWFELCNVTSVRLHTSDFEVINRLAPHPFGPASFPLVPDQWIEPDHCAVFVADDDEPEVDFDCGEPAHNYSEKPLGTCGTGFTFDRELGGRLQVVPRPGVDRLCGVHQWEFAVSSPLFKTLVPIDGEDGGVDWESDDPTPGWGL